jgi:hypothetical protein
LEIELDLDPNPDQKLITDSDPDPDPGLQIISGSDPQHWTLDSLGTSTAQLLFQITQWPYIAIIDPRTGENMVTWTHVEADGFPELITEFLSLHPALDSPAREPPRYGMLNIDTLLSDIS